MQLKGSILTTQPLPHVPFAPSPTLSIPLFPINPSIMLLDSSNLSILTYAVPFPLVTVATNILFSSFAVIRVTLQSVL